MLFLFVEIFLKDIWMVGSFGALSWFNVHPPLFFWVQLNSMPFWAVSFSLSLSLSFRVTDFLSIKFVAHTPLVKSQLRRPSTRLSFIDTQLLLPLAFGPIYQYSSLSEIKSHESSTRDLNWWNNGIPHSFSHIWLLCFWTPCISISPSVATMLAWKAICCPVSSSLLPAPWPTFSSSSTWSRSFVQPSLLPALAFSVAVSSSWTLTRSPFVILNPILPLIFLPASLCLR